MFIGVVGSTLASNLVDYRIDRALTVAIFSYCFAGKSNYKLRRSPANNQGLVSLLVSSSFQSGCTRTWHLLKPIREFSPSRLSGYKAYIFSGVIPSYLISVGVPGFPSLTLMNLANVISTISERRGFLSGIPGYTSAADSAKIFATVSVLLSFLLIVSIYFRSWWLWSVLT